MVHWQPVVRIAVMNILACELTASGSMCHVQFEALAGFSAVVDRLGEFQEVVDDKLRHEFTHTSGSSATKSDHTDSLADMPSPEAAQVATAMADGKGVQAPVVLSGAQSGMSNASASSSTIQMIQVLEDTGSISKNGRSHGNGQPTSSSSTSNINDKTASCAGDVLLELQGLSITTPDGSLKLVQDLSYKVWHSRVAACYVVVCQLCGDVVSICRL